MAEETKEKAKNSTRSVDLSFGYEDKETPGKFHRVVTFGTRSTGGDVIRSADEANGSEVQYTLGMIAGAITRFGDLTMPVPMTVLLALDEIDRDELAKSYFKFLDETVDGETETKRLDIGKAQLAFGIEREGVKYTIVEFGKRLTGYDDVEIEREAKTEAQNTVLSRARRVAKISTADGAKTVDGAMTLAEMQSLDYVDFIILKEVGDEWLNSFRRR